MEPMDPINREPEEHGQAASRRPPRESLTSDFGQSTPALARTAHVVAGDLLLLSQKMIPVEAHDSFTAVMNKAMSAVPDMVLDVIRRFQANRATPLQNDASQGSYFSFPQRADAKKFRRMGKRFF